MYIYLYICIIAIAARLQPLLELSCSHLQLSLTDMLIEVPVLKSEKKVAN